MIARETSLQRVNGIKRFNKTTKLTDRVTDKDPSRYAVKRRGLKEVQPKTLQGGWVDMKIGPMSVYRVGDMMAGARGINYADISAHQLMCTAGAGGVCCVYGVGRLHHEHS